jgi:hypothetical protein
MSARDNSFASFVAVESVSSVANVAGPSPPVDQSAASSPNFNAATARLHGFDLSERPTIAGLAVLPNEIVPARTTVPLRQRDVGSTVTVLFEGGDLRRPIIVGVIQCATSTTPDEQPKAARMSAVIDGDKFVLTAEREIVLQCGEASITLTRAGKVIIKGSYIVSRSTGYNKIKGAAIDIN